MAVLTRVYRPPGGWLPPAPSAAPAAPSLDDLVKSGAVHLPAGDVFGAIHAAMAYASSAGCAERITLLTDGPMLRLLVTGPKDGVRAQRSVTPRLPGTLPDKLLASVLESYRVPYRLLHVDFLPESQTVVCAFRIEQAG